MELYHKRKFYLMMSYIGHSQRCLNFEESLNMAVKYSIGCTELGQVTRPKKGNKNVLYLICFKFERRFMDLDTKF